MHAAAREIATEAGWRLQSLLRVRRFFKQGELVRMYKAQILSYIESSTPGIYHAAVSVLDCIDRVQKRFCREINIDEITALSKFRLAPLCTRRDISILGVFHKIRLGIASTQISTLFPLIGVIEEPLIRQRLRYWRPLHNKQLFAEAQFNSSDLMMRSAFGLVHCYNRLPQHMIDLPNVQVFQRKLQNAVLQAALLGMEDWQHLFSIRWKQLTMRDFDNLF